MLSKSRYLAGRQCAKRLWIELHRRELVPPVNEETQAIFDQGHEVGRLAQQLFPGGIEIVRERFDWAGAVAATREALARRLPIYEAAFVHGGAGCRVDILAPAGDGSGESEGRSEGESEGAWDLYEVKSGTSPKDENFEDVALQAWIVREAGLALRKTFLVHLDSSYVRRGELELDRLLRRVDVGGEVEARAPLMPGRVAELLRVAARETEPDIAIGPHCRSPRPCPLVPHCWRELPAENVLDLRHGGQKAWRLLGEGITELKSIPDTVELSSRQRIQVAAARSGEAHVDRAAVGSFLGRLDYPRYFLDFETYAPAAPPFDDTRAYGQIPFQFSLHVVEKAGAAPRASAWLAPDGADPRRGFLEALRRELGEMEAPGSIVAYNVKFERDCLAECAALFPGHGEWAARAGGRFVDLLQPFESFAYHHPAQRGSASLKAVLPVLGERGYDHLAIQDGRAAARAFQRSNLASTPPEARASIRQGLLDYCGRDTEGMVEIVAALERLAGA